MEGTYFRNGPGLQVTNSNSSGSGGGSGAFSRHAFDGDGLIARFSFKGGRAAFSCRFVRTEGFLAEQVAGRPLQRSAFTKGAADGSPFFNPFDMRLKNPANTGALLSCVWRVRVVCALGCVSRMYVWRVGAHMIAPTTQQNTTPHNTL